jgi:hypothetical protein
MLACMYASMHIWRPMPSSWLRLSAEVDEGVVRPGDLCLGHVSKYRFCVDPLARPCWQCIISQRGMHPVCTSCIVLEPHRPLACYGVCSSEGMCACSCCMCVLHRLCTHCCLCGSRPAFCLQLARSCCRLIVHVACAHPGPFCECSPSEPIYASVGAAVVPCLHVPDLQGVRSCRHCHH